MTKRNNKIKSLLEENVFYIAPVFNPDGYVYTFTDDRLWRKTRRPTEKDGCIGTDVNRNLDFKWGGQFNFVNSFKRSNKCHQKIMIRL